MFFGNMQSYYRRNSIHNQSPSHGSKSKPFKEYNKRGKHLDPGDNGDEDEEEQYGTPMRRKSFNVTGDGKYEERDNNRINVPVIKIGLYEPEPAKKSFNILKEKERALWYNNCSESDNSVRLGPNTNNIIQETLRQTGSREQNH